MTPCRLVDSYLLTNTQAHKNHSPGKGMLTIYSLNKDEVAQFIEQANSHHPILSSSRLKYPTRKQRSSTQMFTKYTHFSSCHPPGVKKGFIKGEALRLLRSNSSEIVQTAIPQFKTNLIEKGYSEALVQQLSQKSHLRRENLPYSRNVNKTHESCLLSDNIVHQCLTTNAELAFN